MPTLEPLTFHWNAGVVPPLEGVAVKVTEPPAQIVVALAAIETPGVTFAFTTILIPVLVAVAGDGQAALLVNTQVTASALLRPDVVYVLLFDPALLPFTFHW